MSRMNPQEYQILQDNKFNLYCSVLGIKEQCCFAPDKKVIERAFRKSALKCHPDKGGDPVVFKKLNEAYNKLIGHIGKLEQQTEAIELANSILIEVSKTSVSKWHEKLKTRYGWFKTDNCKNIIFDGPYKQYMGRSKNTGNITVVLYEDPPDQIPKIHVRSSKYMAWIAEQMMPVHMHVEKGKTIQFDQWRIAHLAEFGICNFASATPPAPAPAPAPAKPKPKTPKAKRREAREESERRAKTRRDSEPTPEPGDKNTETENNKENAEPKKSEPSDINGKSMDVDKDEDVEQNPVIEEKPFNCGHCGEGFNNLMDYALHKKICVPDEDFGFISGMKDVINNQYKTEKKVEFADITEKNKPGKETTEPKESPCEPPKMSQSSEETTEPKFQNSPRFQCDKCDQKFTNMVWYAKHKNTCQVEECEEPTATSNGETVSESNSKHEDQQSKSSNNIPTQVNNCEEPPKQSSLPKHSKTSSVTNGKNVKNDNDSSQKTSQETVIPTPKKSEDIKIDSPMQPPIDNNVKETTEKKNNHGTKTDKNVKNDNDSSQKASKENVCPTPKEFKDMKIDSPMQPPMDINVEEATQKKYSQGTKTGKVIKPTKPAKLKKTLSKDLEDVDIKKRTETKTSVEYMDVDEPETTKKADVIKPAQKKNDMPMGSLLHNLPTTANPPPAADMEMEKSVDKSKEQVDKQNSCQQIIENEVPDKKSKPVVKFNLDMHSNSDKDLAKKHSNLDLDALELTNKIFSTTNNDTYDVKEAVPKTKEVPNKALHKTPSQTKILGDLDKEAIKLTNVIFSNTNDTTESEDMEAYLNSSKKPISKPKAPLKSIMKNTTLKNKINKDGESDNLNMEKENAKLKQNPEMNISKCEENQDLHKNGLKSSILDEKVSTNGGTVPQRGFNKDSLNEKTKEREIHVNGMKESLVKPCPDKTAKNDEHPSIKINSQVNEKITGKDSLNSEKSTKIPMHTNGGTEASANSKPDTKTNKNDKTSIQNSTHANETSAAHTNFTKNMAVNVTPTNTKNEVKQLDHSNQQNRKVDNVVKMALDTNTSKKYGENKSGSSLTSTNNSKEHSCADQIYKEKQPGLEIIESHKSKINESITPTVKTSLQSSSKNLQTNIVIKHAQQCFVVNHPLSPPLNRKDISQKARNPQTEGQRLGSQSEIVLDQKSVAKIPNTVNSESKKVVVVSQIPNDTKTKGGITRFLEESGHSYTSPQIATDTQKSDLNKDLEKMDKDHAVNMQRISETMKNSSKEKTSNLYNNEVEKLTNNVNSEFKKVVVVSQKPNDTKTNMKQKVESKQLISDNIYKKSIGLQQDKLVPNGLSLVPQALQRSYTSPQIEKNSNKSDLNKDLEKLDKQHAVKMQRIGQAMEDTSKEKKLDLSNTEVHTKRPAILGPSRFDDPTKFSTGYLKENVPKRNDTAYNFDTESLSKTNSATGTFDKPPPASSYQISKSSTTVLDTRKKSPEEYRKKLDRNFNVSPEPFFSSKSNNTVHFSDQPSSKYEGLYASNTSSMSSSLKATSSKENSYSKPSDAISTNSQSAGSKAYAPSQSLSSSKSYSSSTLPSVSSLPTPASLSSISGPYSSQSYNPSPSSYSSSTYPSVASLPTPASFSSASDSFSSPIPYKKQVNYTSSTSPSTFSSPSNYSQSAQSSNFDNRAKSEGSTLSTNSLGTMQSSYSLSNSSSKPSSDLYMKIQATKDKHKSDIESVMSLDKTNWKPPVIKQKLPRPDPTPAKYSMTLGRDKTTRIQDRERTVIDRLMTDRASRGKSDDFLKSSSYRL